MSHNLRIFTKKNNLFRKNLFNLCSIIFIVPLFFLTACLSPIENSSPAAPIAAPTTTASVSRRASVMGGSDDAMAATSVSAHASLTG